MIRRGSFLVLACAIVAVDLIPVALLIKQAVTPERESFSWPPTWLPEEPTLANFRAVANGIELARGFWMSMIVSGSSVALTLALTAPAAWLAARRARVDRGLDVVLVLTRLFPSIALAIPLATLFVRLGLYNHPAGVGLCLAHTLLAAPVAFFILRTGFRAIPLEIEEAALLDGAGPFTMFRCVILPLVRPSLAAAAILVFLVSWDEFAYALLLQVTNRSLPPLLYYFSAFGYPGLASALAVAMLLPALLIIIVLEPALRAGALTGSGR